MSGFSVGLVPHVSGFTQPVWLRWSRSPVENRYPPHDALPLEAPGGEFRRR